MRAATLVSALFWTAASAQTILPPQRGAESFSRGSLGVLKCEVRQLPPELDFSFRFRAGYSVSVPLNQYHGAGHRWTVLVRLQSAAAGQPVYFVDRLRLPDVPSTRITGEAGGGYLLGLGSYRASFLLRDDQSRTCRAEWNIDARLRPADRHVKLAMERGTAAELSLRGWRSEGPVADPPLSRLTVLLNAAPVGLSRSTMQASDAVTLLGALSSLLRLAPADSVRLVVFNLDRQKEIYRKDHFTLDQLDAVRQAIFNLQLGVVDYQTLRHPEGRADLLEGLVNRELEAEDRADAVVFLGPHARWEDRPAPAIGTRGASTPRFFYLEYQQPATLASAVARGRGRMGRATSLRDIPSGVNAQGDVFNTYPTDDGLWASATPFLPDTPHDTIDRLVAGLKGKTLVVTTPSEFSRAMKQISGGK